MGNIRIIGPRGSGKTTYLASLAYWPEKNIQQVKPKKFTIYPLNEDTKKLAEKAENIIYEGDSLEPTTVAEGIDGLPSYSFKIELKSPLFRQTQEIFLAVRDYPGEVFDEIESGINNKLYKDFIEESFRGDVDGCLILLPDWGRKADKYYSRLIKKFTLLMDSYKRTNNLRLAVALSKCERGELWSGRLDPEIDLFDAHLPQTKAILQNTIPQKNLAFYAISTFGVLGRNNPRPNRMDELGTYARRSVLREGNKWQPYGIVSPLYWLSTGKRMRYDA
jgi:hypothetical protein